MTNTRTKTALELMLTTMESVRGCVVVVGRFDRDRHRQLKRAINSVILNLAEANGRRGGDRRRSIETARGSLEETRVALKLAMAWGYLPEKKVERIDAVLDRVGAMTWRWLHSA